MVRKLTSPTIVTRNSALVPVVPSPRPPFALACER